MATFTKLVIQRRPHGNLPWEDYAYPKDDMETAMRILKESSAWEAAHSKFPGKFRLIRQTIEIIAE